MLKTVTVRVANQRTKMAEDSRNLLDEEPFAYRPGKDGKVFISWQGKQVLILKGKQAETFLRKIDGLAGKDAQLVMAKVTGNFKRGNERQGKLPWIYSI